MMTQCLRHVPNMLITLCGGRFVVLSAGLNTAITRTPFATSLILTALSGHPEIAVPCLASSLVALFLTLHFPFIMSQRDRRDLTIKELELESESNPGQVVHIDHGHFSGRAQDATDGDQLESQSYDVRDSHVQNWVISGQLTNANGHVEAPATPDQDATIGGV